MRRLRGGTSAADSRAVAALYQEHGRGELYLTPEEAGRELPELLPGARVVYHLEWRYTAVWQCPDV